MKIERIVVTGGRKFNDAFRIEADLRALLLVGLRRVAEGACPYGGADDTACEAWMRFACDGEGVRYPMQHAVDGPGKRAYLRRNIRMLEAERPDLVPAYPDRDSRGTWHCVGEALRRQIPVVIWHPFCGNADLLDPRLSNGALGCMFGMAWTPLGPHRTAISTPTLEAIEALRRVFAG